MRNVQWIWMLLCVACSEPDLDQLRLDEPVLFSVLYAGESPSGIRFIHIRDNQGGYTDVPGATMSIGSQTSETFDLKYSEQGYYLDTDFTIVPDETYTLSGSDASGNLLMASTRIPPSVELISIDEDTIVNSGPGNLASALIWTNLDTQKYAYILKLENQEETKIEISSDGGKFESRYLLPQLNPQLQLLKDDFRFYGLHKLTVYAIEREFESVFFFDAADIRGLLKPGPDNVIGGKGYLTGVSSFTVSLFVSE